MELSDEDLEAGFGIASDDIALRAAFFQTLESEPTSKLSLFVRFYAREHGRAQHARGLGDAQYAEEYFSDVFALFAGMLWHKLGRRLPAVSRDMIGCQTATFRAQQFQEQLFSFNPELAEIFEKMTLGFPELSIERLLSLLASVFIAADTELEMLLTSENDVVTAAERILQEKW